jgi:hypothetical protein
MNRLFLSYLIVEAIFGISFIFIPGILLGPLGLTLDETSTIFARLFGTAIIGIPVLLFFARKSTSVEFKRGATFCIFIYLFASTIILLITIIKGLMNALGWSIIILHLVYTLWSGYYLIKPQRKDLVL